MYPIDQPTMKIKLRADEKCVWEAVMHSGKRLQHISLLQLSSVRKVKEEIPQRVVYVVYKPVCNISCDKRVSPPRRCSRTAEAAYVFSTQCTLVYGNYICQHKNTMKEVKIACYCLKTFPYTSAEITISIFNRVKFIININLSQVNFE